MKRTGAWILGLLTLSLVLGWAARDADPSRIIAALETFKSKGWAGDAAFVAIYALCVVFMVPGTLPNLAAGIIYGVVKGSLLVTLGASLGSGIAFLIARFAMRDFVKRRFLSSERFRSLDRAAGDRGFRLVALLRLSPLMPYNILNYALGVTRISLQDFLAGGLSIIPSVILYVGMGNVAGRMLLHTPAENSETTALRWALQALGLFASTALTVWLGQLASSELKAAQARETAAPEAPETPTPPRTRPALAAASFYLQTSI